MLITADAPPSLVKQLAVAFDVMLPYNYVR